MSPKAPNSMPRIYADTSTDFVESNAVARPAPLLFVNKGQHNLKTGRSIEEQTAIKLHLSRRQQKRAQYKQISFDSSTRRILNQSQNNVDRESVPSKLRLPATLDHPASIAGYQNIKLAATRLPLPCLSAGTTVLDPFGSEGVLIRDFTRLIFLYLRHIRPLAAAVSPIWDWVDNVAEIRASEMLSNAVAAYTTAFIDGLKRGSRGVVLPPLPEKGKQPLWNLPAWFRYHTRCLTLLNVALQDDEQRSGSEVFHTVLFILRLIVLFGDGPAANIHFKALRQVAFLPNRHLTTLSYESSVTQVNFVTLFLYKAAMVKKANRQITDEYPAYVIEPDRHQWTNQREWAKFAGMLYGRSLTWRANTIDTTSTPETRRIVLHLDPEAAKLPSDDLRNLLRHYQIGLFLWSYLLGINYDPSLPKIKLRVGRLELFLRSRNAVLLEDAAPKVFFFLCFCGTYGSRGQTSRPWFIQRLASTTIQVYTMRDLWVELEHFADPLHCMPILLEEILYEMGRKDIYTGGPYRRLHGAIPISHDPDLLAPIRDAQNHDELDATLRNS